MIFDDKDNIVLLYGGTGQFGVLSDLWKFNVVTDRWTKITDNATPGARFVEMTYDFLRNRVFFYGGWAGMSRPIETWVYDLTTSQFSTLAMTYLPTGRNHNSLVYDPHNDIYIMFGGFTGLHTDITEVYNPITDDWSNPTLSVSPTPRQKMHTVYDTSVNRVVLFGGTGTGVFDDVWLFEYQGALGSEWVELQLTSGPVPRFGYAMAYHPAEERTYIFGGSQGDLLNLNDLWVLNMHSSFIETETTTITNVDTTTQISQSLVTSTVIETDEITVFQTEIKTTSIISTESSALPSFVVGISSLSLVLVVIMRKNIS